MAGRGEEEEREGKGERREKRGRAGKHNARYYARAVIIPPTAKLNLLVSFFLSTVFSKWG